MRKKVLAPALVPITSRWEEQPRTDLLRQLRDRLSQIADVEVRKPATSQEWNEVITGVNIIAGVAHAMVNDVFLEAADKLEMIQSFGIGYDRIDIPACTRRNIIVCNVAEIYSEPVAQHAWALILDLTKHVTRADRAMRAGNWQSQNWMGFQLWGKTLGVIGLGNIGGRVAMKGRLAFGMKILAYDPLVSPEHTQLFGAEAVSLERLLKESDIVSICVPLTSETHHLIAEEQLSMMKKTALIVNASRGAVVDEKALVKSIMNGSISGAGLDVFETEPLPADNPLLRMENVVLTPHIASSTFEAVEKTYRGAVENIVRHLEGLRPHWMINTDAYRG